MYIELFSIDPVTNDTAQFTSNGRCKVEHLNVEQRSECWMA